MSHATGLTNLIVQTRERVRRFRQARRDQKTLRAAVIRLALPAAGERMLSMTVSIVNTILVGHLGAAPLAAVSLASQWGFMAITLFDALCTGATALIARSVGANDWKMANRTLCQSLILAVLVGLLATAAATIWTEPAMRLTGADPETLPLGETYLRITGAAFVFQAIMFVGNASLRGAGNTRAAMIVMTVVNVINILVSWVAINGPWGLPRLGVAGSALGANAGHVAGSLLVVGMLLRGNDGLKLTVRGFRAEFDLIKRIVRIGIPTGVERLLMRAGQMVFLSALAGIGTVAVAAHAVALRAESFSFMPGFGFAVAGTTMVGQALGAHDPKRAAQSGYITFEVSALLMAVMGLIFILLPRPLITLFTDDLAVIELAVTPLRIVGFVQPLLAASMVFPGCLRGAGDTRFPMIITGISIWAIRVPSVFLLGLALGWGLNGAWLGMALDLAVRGVIFFLRFRSGRWQTAHV
ncbi:MAG: MATE family efflux transporter [Anaerolineae bacterium]|nr:MATE family efflux transporter [Anaerolineae bacterium]